MEDILINKIGPSIRTHDGGGCLGHVPFATPIYLNMDNAGGHGTIIKKASYCAAMLFIYNIIIVFQPPNSLDTNALDVGFWCAIQAEVSKLCRKVRMYTAPLVQNVQLAWRTFDSPEGAKKLENIVDYLRIEAINTVLDNGGNDKAESVRGKKKATYAADYIPAVVYIENRAEFLQSQQQNAQIREVGEGKSEESEGGGGGEEEEDDYLEYEAGGDVHIS